jgi:hypothetical protein
MAELFADRPEIDEAHREPLLAAAKALQTALKSRGASAGHPDGPRRIRNR